MAEHLYAHRLAGRAADLLPLYLIVDVAHLLHVQFTGQHADVGKLSIELQCLHIADVELSGEVHLHAYLAAIDHHGDIGGDDSRNAGLTGCVDDGVHRGHVLVIDDGVDGEIGLHAMLVADARDVVKIADVEMIGTVRPHVQLSDTKVYGVGAGLQSCSE